MNYEIVVIVSFAIGLCWAQLVLLIIKIKYDIRKYSAMTPGGMSKDLSGLKMPGLKVNIMKQINLQHMY